MLCNNELCGHIYDKKGFVGSCVPINKYNCFISAAHVILGKDHDGESKVSSREFKIDYLGKKYKIVNFNYKKPTRDNDLILLYIDEVINLPKIEVMSPIYNNILSSKQNIIVNINGNNITDTISIREFKERGSNSYFCYSYHDVLINRRNDRYGHQALNGISGSGLFYTDEDNNYYLTGITISIPNSQSAEIEFSSLDIMRDLIVNFEILDSKSFDKDIRKLLSSIDSMNKKRDELTSSDWLNNIENKVQSDNLINKCNQIFYGDNTINIRKEIDKMVISFLDGNNIIEELEKNHSQIFSVYKSFFDNESTDSRMKRYHDDYQVYDIYEEELSAYKVELNKIIAPLIKDFPDCMRPQINTLSKRDIVHLLNECDLRFIKRKN
ncbi:hypothetical protein L4D04_02615 [Photobacterium angustum]|uniref:Peptidase S1 domain-containing protein n=1 Tax=Photobacterium angustum (strain S14 / CCUG 15956) TaxID=314292 RepID=Q1ZP99_PHOAS|nr:hypothetical protein [Photobacterium angustum]EAS64061.1 hypothetical protein VAS14_17446 [Photobacterium angustum S14]